ncbi:hypothetical protein [Streptomyces sp. NPDC051567]|uniref:hypothetical protein n=1 Tax=Streptomyces sp. NPDC051567 TaxID=3365660 RepID=UPI0037A56C11
MHPSPPRPDPVLDVLGGKRLSGTVATSGFKHSLVTLAGAAAVADAPVRIDNCPDIVETDVLSGLFRSLGGRATRTGDSLTLDASGFGGGRAADVPADLATRIHGSSYLLTGLLARHGAARMPASGGCRIGEGPQGRPVEHFLSILERFGARGRIADDGALEVRAERLLPCTVDLLDYTRNRALMSGPQYGGATKTALLAAVMAEGTSTLRHLYPKPDVTDLVEVLRALGADIEDDGPETLVVRGRGPGSLRRAAAHTLMPDLIEIITWVCVAVTLADGPLRATGPGMARAVRALRPEFDLFDRMGVELSVGDGELLVHPAERPLRPVEFTAASRSVFSDSQPFFALLGALAEGPTTITEAVWENRYGYVPGLIALGMRATQDGRVLRVDGPCPPRLPGRTLTGTDLRASAALLLAALAVPGRTLLHGGHHLDRGYRDLPGDLRSLGADIAAVAGPADAPPSAG